MRWWIKILFIELVLLYNAIGYGQTIKWSTGFNGFFDNREYFNDYSQPQTMFGARLFGIGGITFGQYHEIGAGADILFEFGSKLKNDNIKPIIYYHFNKRSINLYFGSFPRKGLINLPLFLQSDTLLYYRPTCEGMFIEFINPLLIQSVWLDWTSKQTDTIRETFQIGGSGSFKKGFFFYRHDFIMTHYAGSGIRIPDQHIRDNGGLYANLGVNLSSYLFDSLTLSTGYCFSYDRLRSVYDFNFYHGSLSQLYIELFNIGIRSAFYFGDGQIQMWADGLYRAKYYNRTDIVWHMFRQKNIKGSVEFSFHVIENTLDMSQSIKIYVTLGGERKLIDKEMY